MPRYKSAVFSRNVPFSALALDPIEPFMHEFGITLCVFDRHLVHQARLMRKESIECRSSSHQH
jgi:hypothetical protein